MFRLVAPSRTFTFAVETAADMASWLAVLAAEAATADDAAAAGGSNAGSGHSVGSGEGAASVVGGQVALPAMQPAPKVVAL